MSSGHVSPSSTAENEKGLILLKNTFGTNLILTLFGESHGSEIGAVLDGLTPGLPVDEAFIASQLALRCPFGAISTARHEPDEFRIVSGVYRGRTTGTPLCILLPNTDTRSVDYADFARVPRPSHADYTAGVRYAGFNDDRGGGHSSGRLTAPLVAAGAIVLAALREKGILIGTHISRLAGIDDASLTPTADEIRVLGSRPFAVLSASAGDAMRAAIEAAGADGDSVGGVLETAVLGLPAGIGEPWFDSVEGLLAHAIFSIPGVKGVSFGDGFDIADRRGSEANDSFARIGDSVVTKTNHSGGVQGGITNGMPLTFRTAVKPTPSIGKTQKTLDLTTGEETELSVKGRHDPAVVHRARVVVDSVTALVLADLLTGRFGTDYLRED